MRTFEKIHIHGFRRLIDVKLQLRPLTVLIGANGCGKTSLLEAWRLLAWSAEGRFQEGARSLGGIEQLATRPRSETKQLKPVGFQISFENDGSHFEYRQRVLGQYKFEENLLKRVIGSAPIEVLPEKYANSSWSKIYESKLFDSSIDPKNESYHMIKSVQQTLASCELIRPIDIAQLRTWQELTSVDSPGLRGESLFSYLKTLEEKHPKSLEMIVDTLSAGFPLFKRLTVKEVIPGQLAMEWYESPFDLPIYMTQLSEGTLRFLWLIALLLRPELPAVTLIDEPELSLHPQLLMLLVELMREASLRTQLVVATQSDQLVRFLRPEEILAADVEDGQPQFTWGDELDLDHWLKDYTLDQLWTMGVLGGRS